MERYSVISIIVTYNRKALLMECLDAVLSQSYPVSKIVLIDNASTDGTKDELEQKGYLRNAIIDYHLMDSNTGGAGGFHQGMKIAQNFDCDWVWIMDDDTIPTANCLENLILANKTIKQIDPDGPISFLASAVYGENHEYMNLPGISSKVSPNGYGYWYRYLEYGIISISRATFVSVLINKKALEKCGLPDPDFFIWGDDTEYTTRLTTYYGDAYFIGKSVAIHKRKNAKNLNIEDETDIERIKMYHYHFRNSMIFQRYYQGPKAIWTCIKAIIRSPFSLRKKNGLHKMKAQLRGYFEALIQYGKFKSYIDSQLIDDQYKIN